MLRRSFVLFPTFCAKHVYYTKWVPKKAYVASKLFCCTKSFQRNITSTCKFQRNYNSQLDSQRSVETPKTETVNSFTYRSHTCGELRSKHAGQEVTLCGWIQYIRLSKFILLRDSYGLIQCTVNNKDIDFGLLSLESIVKINGVVRLRPKDAINSDLETGEIEVVVDSVELLNSAENIPFNLRNYQKPKEQLRLQYRYVDLRFPEMQNNLRQRSLMLHNMRKYLIEYCSFVEVETPTLFCRTPGGAREFIVPTHHGLFYSLVQSPQQFKQMLMAGAVDRYFQVARCYRDETTRPDRQPEFTQLDIELSFTDLNGVLSLIEQLLYHTFLKELPKPPFNRITYKYAIENYGTDKPNLTYDLKLRKLDELISAQKGNSVYCVPYPKELGKLTAKYKEFIKSLTKKYKTEVVLNENIASKFGTGVSEQIQNIIGPSNASIIAIGESVNSCLSLGEIREMLSKLLSEKGLIQVNNKIEPLWVVDFPLFLKGENGNLETCHHPFTSPHPEDIHLLESDPLSVRSLAYDIVLNGNEIGGGSVRVHNVKLQKRLLELLNINPDTMKHFLNALSSGCPPHAGLALGIDRLVALTCNADSIRDVIAFPKSHDGKDPLSGAPHEISDDDKKYYRIK